MSVVYRCWPSDWMDAAKAAGLAIDGDAGQILFAREIGGDALRDALEIFAEKLTIKEHA